MATSTYSDLPTVSYALVDHYDDHDQVRQRIAAANKSSENSQGQPSQSPQDKTKLIIRIIEQGKLSISSTTLVAKKVHDCKVYKHVLEAASHHFKALGGGSADQSVIIIKQDSAEAAQGVIIWLKILHFSSFDYTAIDIRTVWEMLAVAHKFDFKSDSAEAQAWFVKWYSETRGGPNGRAFTLDEYRSLLFPCFAFDYAQGFTTATKYLTYNGSGHITERRPPGFKHNHLRLDQLIIQQINAAKGRLKTILHRELDDPIEGLMVATCDCAALVHHDYVKSLRAVRVWPLEKVYANSSMQDILGRLESFEGVNKKSGGHPYCSFDFKSAVNSGVSTTNGYFDGLCLDCINHTKFNDNHEDYWRHADRGVDWDDKCRVKHGEPSWYYSFMGRRDNVYPGNQKRARN